MSRVWAIRTVRHGRVKIGGDWYQPQEHHRAYDGRLDGVRMLFGRYGLPGGGYEPFVNLWGTEAAARHNRPPDIEGSPECVDGTLPWLFWDRCDREKVTR